MFDALPSRTRGAATWRDSWSVPMTSVPEPPGARSGAVAGHAPGTLLDGSVRLVELECFTDERGSLTPITLDDHGFSVARTFVVRAPRGAVRGGHAHRSVRQVLFRASGMIDLEVRRGGARARLTLDEEHPAVLLEAGVWAQQTYVGDDSTLIVFADGPYEPTEYAGEDSMGSQGESSGAGSSETQGTS
jgi:dTDP-4-dehydrorhamnose 3,5-epimerase-like enzyme